jgi:hypothetical protein
LLKKQTLWLSVDPVGSLFAKTLQLGLANLDVKAIRCSVEKGDDHRRQGKKVFFVTNKTLNKLEQLTAFKANGVSHPTFTTDPNSVSNLGSKLVFARTLLNSTNGRGIVEFSSEAEQVPSAPLYTAYIPKKTEYRVHVFNGKVIDRQQKRKRAGVDEANFKIRNLANGFVYTRQSLVASEAMDSLAIAAVSAVGYQYGAVDIIYNEKQNSYYVLEVNSKPGLEGSTVVHYCQSIKEMYENC